MGMAKAVEADGWYAETADLPVEELVARFRVHRFSGRVGEDRGVWSRCRGRRVAVAAAMNDSISQWGHQPVTRPPVSEGAP